METKFKDPQAKLPYRGNWAAWLAKEGDDTIATSSWSIVPDGVTADNQSKDDTTTTVRLSGGTAGVRYTVTNHIVTAGGLEDDRSFILDVRQR